MKKNMFLMLAVLLTIAIASCKKSVNDPASVQKVETTDQAKKVYGYIIGLGFPAHTIVENKNEFIVEEDIIFPKNMQVPGAAGTEQYYTGSLVSSTNVTNIRLYIDPSM